MKTSLTVFEVQQQEQQPRLFRFSDSEISIGFGKGCNLPLEPHSENGPELRLLVRSNGTGLLRAIENREIEPVGSEAIVNVNVRIIAATNRDLLEMEKAKQFREDLFHRLNVVPVTVPPLRERLEDIGLLAAHFLEQFCLENGLAEMSFAPDAISQLQRYSWPGNVRELRNVVQRCAASAEAALITGEALKSQLQI